MAHRPTDYYLLSVFVLLVPPSLISSSSSAVQDPEHVVRQVQESIDNASRRRLLGSAPGCQLTGNPIDDCWRCDPKWSQHRQLLADCAIGFGSDAVGGRNGRIYVVTTSADDPVNPSPGMLRYGAIQVEPLWITFARDMVITLKEELLVNSYKTIDGRGASVHVGDGPCITLHQVSNIIIHGINIHDCRPAGNAAVRDSPTHYGWRDVSDGDGVSIYGGRQVWVDHCTLSNCHDGLIDATRGSTAITISNNYMTHHNKVMLFGHSDAYTPDKQMQITVAFNHFGEGLVQRMPRCRHGYFHIVNNDYKGWGLYAIGGSAAPTINSQGNKFYAPGNRFHKEITKREFATQSVWEKWSWRSQGDLMLNGAFFRGSEVAAGAPSVHARASSMGAKSPHLVDSMTFDAGTLPCRVDSHC